MLKPIRNEKESGKPSSASQSSSKAVSGAGVIEGDTTHSSSRSHILVYLLVAGLLAGAVTFFLQRRSSSPIVLQATEPEQVSPEHLIFSVHDIEKLEALKGEVVTVEGIVTEFGESSSGNTRYLNFSENRDDALYFAFSARATSSAYPKGKLESLIGQTVRVKGKVDEYKGRLQIYVSKPSMVLKAGEDE